jgi:mannose-6-phosphate isomerase-like protein (cupin superfamily)
VTYFARYNEPESGFTTVAGRSNGLHRIVLAAGRLGAGEGGPTHLHHGEEILRILAGEVDVTVGDETRRCRAGDVVIIPTDVAHGFTTITETAMEVVAELDAGQLFPVRAEDGVTRLVEVYRSDMPWSRQPPPGFAWTSDAEMADISSRAGEASPQTSLGSRTSARRRRGRGAAVVVSDLARRAHHPATARGHGFAATGSSYRKTGEESTAAPSTQNDA